MKRIAEELQERARRAANNREVALDQQCHLFFFSAVDGDGETRFFDIMKQGQDFSLAETATSAPRLGRCVETAYKDASGARHHVHRNYGQVGTETARQVMKEFGKQTILTEVIQLAETLTHREALPVWKVIFEKLGCEWVALSLESVTDYRMETDQGTSNAGRNRRISAGKRTEAGGVHADTPVDISRKTATISLKTCPHCQREVLTLITDYATGDRYCYHCAPNPEACPGAVFISRKMDQLHAAGKLETCSVEQRLKDMNDPPRCECGAVLDVLNGELCSKCEGEAFRLAHRRRSTPIESEHRDVRPDYFAPAPSAEDAVLRLIKGNFRREMISKSIAKEGLASIPELWCEHNIPEPFKSTLTSTAGPRSRGGEDLPNLAEGEIEIARLSLINSVHGEVTSLRARRHLQDGSILLSMVDEYETEFKLPNTKISAALTAEEVLAVFRDADPTPLATLCQVEFSSFFYPNLDVLASEGRAQQQETTSTTQTTPASDESPSPLVTDPENSLGEDSGGHSYDAAQMIEKLQAKTALKEPYHLLFFSAVDRDGVDRFFDVMEQDGDFSVAETARYAPRLGQCTETTYKSRDGVMHHVHRNYGKYRNVTLHQAMQHFAGMYGLVSLAEMAETRNHLEALPTWDMICARLGCPAGAFVPNSVTQRIDRSTEMTERTGTSSEGHAPESMLDFDKMTPVVSDAELPDGFVRVIMPNGKCFDILEELWTEARRIEPGCVIMSRKATGTKQN